MSKLPTKRKLWAMRRNWLLMRLRGSATLFQPYDDDLLATVLAKEDLAHVHSFKREIKYLINKISESKWKE